MPARRPVSPDLLAAIARTRRALARATQPDVKRALREALAILLDLARAERDG